MQLYRAFSILLVGCFLIAACGNVPPVPGTETNIPLTPTSGTTITPIELQSGYGVRGAWFELYFTNPASPLSPQGTGGLDGPIVDAIDAARLSVEVAAYSLSLNSVRNALIHAHERGATVRVVMESSNMDRSDPQRLIEAGIPTELHHYPETFHGFDTLADTAVSRRARAEHYAVLGRALSL